MTTTSFLRISFESVYKRHEQLFKNTSTINLRSTTSRSMSIKSITSNGFGASSVNDTYSRLLRPNVSTFLSRTVSILPTSAINCQPPSRAQRKPSLRVHDAWSTSNNQNSNKQYTPSNSSQQHNIFLKIDILSIIKSHFTQMPLHPRCIVQYVPSGSSQQ